MAGNNSGNFTGVLEGAAEVSRRGLLGAGGLGLGALLLGGCGTENAGATHSGVATGAPRRGGTLRVAISDGSPSDSLDPGLIITQNTAIVCNAVYDLLTSVDDNFNPLPALAESWESTPDARTWTFHLRQGVTWHDGSPFTSEDVAWTFKRWINPKSGSEMYGDMSLYIDPTGIKTADPHTLVVRLKQPNSVFPILVGSNWAAKIIKAGVTSFSGTAVGTGPFKLMTWTPGTSWTAVANDSYWGGRPYLDGLRITITPDQGAKVQGVIAGSTDCTDDVPISLWASLHGQTSSSLQTYKNKSAWVFAFDQRHAPFNDERVLQALRLATDRNALLSVALQGHGTVVNDIAVVPQTPFYPPAQTPEFNIGKAKALLAAAGYSSGIDIELSTSNVTAGMLDMAQAWQQIVAPAGIRVSLKQFPLNTYYTKGWEATPAFQDYFNRFYPASTLRSFYTLTGAYPDTRFQDPRIPVLIAEILKETNPQARAELTQKALLVAQQNYGYVIPCFTDGGWAQSSKVGGVTWNFVNSMDFRKAWISL